MPEPLSVIALLLFGFIAGWVVRTAVGNGGPAAKDAEGQGSAPAQAPEPAPADVAPPVSSPAPEVAPAPAAEPEAPSAPSPDLSAQIAEAIAAYDDVVDDWLDDRGEVTDSAQGSLERFDAAMRSLEVSDGTDEGVAALRVAADIIHERRRQPLDATTDAALRGLEPRFRP